MRIVFAGTPAPALPSLEALLNSGHEILAVITRPPARAGRGRQLVDSEVSVLAQQAGIPVLTPVSARDPEFLATLTGLAPDAAAVVAYGALLPQTVLDVPTHGWINLHFSLLPAWRGAAPVAAAIRAGDEITGASTFALEAGLDTGPVYGTVTETIRPTDTTGDLLDRLSVSGAALLRATLDGIEAGTLTPVPQPADGVSHVGKITVADAQVHWDHPAMAIDRLIRSCTPEPGSWTTFRGERLGLGPAAPVEALPDRVLAPGELQIGKKEVLVGTGTTPLRLGTVRPPGKQAMAAADWARGSRPNEHEGLT
ncbi:methionyl-tRNA formyltransferase [Nakamurella silvestris]|nr:methionyl-tRNA formyltransferase [Nakamurella silvestris]